MNTSERILNGIKQALTEGESKVNLVEEKAQVDVNETNQLTGSGLDKGGRTYFDDAFAALRYANPFRQGARQVTYNGSAALFVAKTGNVLNQTGENNPWGYSFIPNDGETGIETSIWQLPTRNLSAQLPLRTAVLSDINNIDSAIVNDLILEFSAAEAQAMATNNDQAGSTTYNTGAVEGLRGLAYYGVSASAAAYGSSGTAITNGIHTVLKEDFPYAAITYDDMVNAASKLPGQYWSLPTTAWHLHPALITQLRKLKSTGGGVPFFTEVGDDDGGALAFVFGFPVIPNPYLQAPASGSVSGVLANWDQFMTIADNEEMSIKRYDQTAPGYITLYAEKRLASTIRNPFAGVFLVGA
jgi:HK97 family phage major capsid protein